MVDKMKFPVYLNYKNVDPKNRTLYIEYNLAVINLLFQGIIVSTSWLGVSVEVIVKLGVLLFFYFVPMAGETMYLLFNDLDIVQIATTLSILLMEYHTLIKIITQHYKKKFICEMIDDMKSEAFEPKYPEHVQIFKESLQSGRFLTMTYINVCFWGLLVSSLSPLFGSTRMLSTSFDFPGFDVLQSPIYEIMFCYQIMYRPTGSYMHGAFETMPASFMYFAIEQLDILAFDLENMDVVAERNMKSCDEILDDCIKRHKFIFKYVRKIEATYSLNIALEFLFTGVTICMTMVSTLSLEHPTENIMLLAFTIVFIMNLVYGPFTYCYAGNEIILKSEYLMTATFNSPWIDKDPKLKKRLLIFRERCKQPMIVVAGDLIDLSLASFTSMLQWSYKAFAVLNTMKV